MSIEFVCCHPAANSYFKLKTYTLPWTPTPFPPTVAAATIAPAHTDSRSLSIDPKRMAVIKVWVLLNKQGKTSDS